MPPPNTKKTDTNATSALPNDSNLTGSRPQSEARSLSDTQRSTPFASLTRRQVIQIVAGAGTALTASAAGVLLLNTHHPGEPQPLSREELIEWTVRDALSYLKLEPGGLRAFASRYVQWQSQQPHPPEEPQRDIVERYLMSTNFFRNNADESQLVEFVVFYDPYLMPCYSPFSG